MNAEDNRLKLQYVNTDFLFFSLAAEVTYKKKKKAMW